MAVGARKQFNGQKSIRNLLEIEKGAKGECNLVVVPWAICPVESNGKKHLNAFPREASRFRKPEEKDSESAAIRKCSDTD